MQEIKFKLTSESITNSFGVKLFRIEATCDIPSRGVKKGDKGGFVESTHLRNGNARIADNAWVSGDAQVFGDAMISGNAQVYGNAMVSGEARIAGDARVYGNAEVFGDAWVSGASLNAKASFTKGLFVGRNDGEELKTTVLHKECCDYWDNTYILGDYEITPIECEKTDNKTITIGGKKYEVTEELTKALANLKESE